jgi:hypothetical protein
VIRLHVIDDVAELCVGHASLLLAGCPQRSATGVVVQATR